MNKPVSDVHQMVPMKYSYKTRLGGWSEEWELEETKLKDYKKMQEGGNIQGLESDKKKALSEARASLSYLPDGVLRNGSTVMFHNTFNGHNLSANVWDKIPGIGELYGSTATSIPIPMTRTVFKFNKVEDTRDPVIYYGDKVRISANPRLFGKDQIVWMMSQYSSPTSFAKVSHNQELSFTHKSSTFSTIWEIEHVDPKIRFEMVGEPVPVRAEVLIKHAHTSNWLGSEKGVLKNIYGNELEVFVHSFYDTKKSQNLIAERVGRVTGDTPLRGQGKQNAWVLVPGQRECDEFDETQLDKPIKCEDITNGIGTYMKNKGLYGLRGLRQMFNRVDENGVGTLEEDDLKWALRNYGIHLIDDEVRTLMNNFSASEAPDRFSYNCFLHILNNLTTPGRLETVAKFYQKMKEILGEVTLEGLAKLFDATKHPHVLEKDNKFKYGGDGGDAHEQDVFAEFTKNWWDLEPFVPISQASWAQYYSDMSACVLRDDHFERFILSPFNLYNL